MGVIRIKQLKMILLFALLIPLWVCVGSVHAQRRYVSDRLIVTIRDAPRKDGVALRKLATDTPVKVLEESGRYLKVRTEEGEEGWVGKQYISADLPKPIIIAGLRKEIDRLKARIKQFETGGNPMLAELEAAKQIHLAKVKELEENAAEIIGERSRLRKANEQLHRDIEHLQKEIADLRGTGKLRWFLAGAAVFCLGLIAGQVARRKKKYYIDL
ncbi:MAG: TIGR04211 family SH3 domain-containing protein [Deltaproteobacteria bacterium]|nr:TIGR04211 family SH3 domain-containing protein [Deltaproteobacteria bacterium]MBW2340477.1 TIGR04211 family SH3 domain-containing protein [Deltaproteobacteria bacterium]